MISAAKEEIIKAYYPGYFMQSVDGQIQTRQAQIKYDDSYRGKTVLLLYALGWLGLVEED